MTVTIAIVLGLLISAACLGIPQFVRLRNQRLDDDDTQAYLKEVGRSAQEVAQGNAAELQKEIDAASQQAAGSAGPPPGEAQAPESRRP